MGGSMASTPQGNGSNLAQMFGQNAPTSPRQIAPIQAPGPGQFQPPAPLPIMPTQQQAAAATQARMLARTPPPPIMTAPTTAPQKREFYHGGGSNR